MKGTRHTEEQIIAILKQGEAGLCRQHGVTEQSYYRWKATIERFSIREFRTNQSEK
jgi:putative transposase